jgi:hypothetical protein
LVHSLGVVHAATQTSAYKQKKYCFGVIEVELSQFFLSFLHDHIRGKHPEAKNVQQQGSVIHIN